jgi:hypothetical protein
MTLSLKSCGLSFGALVATVAGVALPSSAAAATYVNGCEKSPNPYVCTYKSSSQLNNSTPSLSRYCQATTMKGVPTPVKYVMQFCPYRVWLHQHADGSGWALCLQPQHGLYTLNSKYWYPGNIQITSNTAGCP